MPNQNSSTLEGSPLSVYPETLRYVPDALARAVSVKPLLLWQRYALRYAGQQCHLVNEWLEAGCQLLELIAMVLYLCG